MPEPGMGSKNDHNAQGPGSESDRGQRGNRGTTRMGREPGEGRTRAKSTRRGRAATSGGSGAGVVGSGVKKKIGAAAPAKKGFRGVGGRGRGRAYGAATSAAARTRSAAPRTRAKAKLVAAPGYRGGSATKPTPVSRAKPAARVAKNITRKRPSTVMTGYKKGGVVRKKKK